HPTRTQVEIAHSLVDAGVDVILGHHPHILQGVERYKGAVIAYSLGNFVYDQWQTRLRESMILWLTIRGPREIDCELHPVLINSSHQPVPLEGARAADARRRVDALRERIGAISPSEYERELKSNYHRFRRE